MKKLIMAAGVSALLMGTSALADGATVAKEFGCGISPEASGLSAHLFTTESTSVVTPSGNASLVCHFDVPEELQSEVIGAMHSSDFACSTHAGITYNTKATTNKNTVLLICQLPD